MQLYSRPNKSSPDYFSDIETTVKNDVRVALEEDVHLSKGGVDITASLIPASKKATAELVAREDGLLCGAAWFEECFYQLESSMYIEWYCSDGDTFEKDAVICSVHGNARAILTAERSALNLLQTLSGTASAAKSITEQIKHTKCKLLDTRKTVPGLRIAQKYAVFCGGGNNHRIGLYDAFLIKENHIRACGGINQAIQKAKTEYPDKLVEIEVESEEELKLAIEGNADIVMLDNFSNQAKRAAVMLNNNRVKLEASGNIDQQTIASVAETGVDFISVGAITKHVKATDYSLLIREIN